MSGIPDVWNSTPDDATLVKSFQKTFSKTDSQVIAVFKASKCNSRGETMLVMENIRFLVIACKMSGRKFHPELHRFTMVKRLGAPDFEERGSPINLKLLVTINTEQDAESIVDYPIELSWGAQGFQAVLNSQRSTATSISQMVDVHPHAETKIQYAMENSSTQHALACVLFLACRTFLTTDPKVVGIALGDIAKWKKSRKQLASPYLVLGGPTKVLLQDNASEHDGDVQYLSDKDQEQLNSLLEMFSADGDMQVSVLKERLNAEYAALEAANVHAILDSTDQVPKVLRKIDIALSKLEDLELSLEVFDGKLIIMRDDIAAIEARNNTLEIQTRNLSSLKVSLLELLTSLSTDRNIQKLASAAFSEEQLEGIVAAASKLQNQLDMMTGTNTGMKSEVQSMRAVVNHRHELTALSLAFRDRAKSHINRVFSDSHTLDPRKGFPAEHSTWKYAPLIDILAQLHTVSVLDNVTATFCLSMQTNMRMLMRQKAHAVQSDLKNVSESLSEKQLKTGSRFNTAVVRLLQELLPLFTHCADYVADLLLMRADRPALPFKSGRRIPQAKLSRPQSPLTPAGQAHIEGMLTGLDGDMFAMIAAAPPGSAVPLIPVAAHCAAWRAHLMQFPAAERLCTMLAGTEQRCRAKVDVHADSLARDVERFDGSSKLASLGDAKSVRHLHVLPFVEQVELQAMELRGVMSGGLSPIVWYQPSSGQNVIFQGPAIMAHATELTASFFNRAYKAIFATLVKLAAGDPKHGCRLLLENYSYMEQSMNKLSTDIPELVVWSKELGVAMQHALDTYVDQQLLHSRLAGLLQMAVKLHSLLKDVSPAEVPFQVGFSRQAVSQLVKESLDGLDKKIASIGQRVSKHLETGNRLVHDRVRGTLRSSLMSQYTQLQADLRACYPDLRLDVPTSQLEAMLKVL